MTDVSIAQTEKERAEVDLIRAQAESERATARATTDKATAEIAQLRTPFLMRGTFWTAMIPILTGAAVAIYTLNSGYFSSKAEVLKAQTDLLEFKKKTFEAQVTEIEKQINAKEGELRATEDELRATKQELAASPVRTLIGTVEKLDTEDGLPANTFGELVDYVKASPELALPLLDEAAKTAKTSYQRLVLAFVGLAATNDATWFDRMLAIGDEAIGTADLKQIGYNYFWRLFTGGDVSLEVADQLLTSDRKKKSCDLLIKAFMKFAPDESKSDAADAISSDLIRCAPGRSTYFFEVPPADWKPVAEAAAQHLGIVQTVYYADSYADMVSRTNAFAAALLFAAEWKEANWTDESVRYAHDLAEDLATDGAIPGLPSKEAGIPEWKDFFEQNSAKLAQIRGQPIDGWPQT